MLSTPIKIKQETTEVTHARVKFEGVLQNLIERADGSLPLDDEITIKDEQDFDRSFEDDIRELEATPVTKSPSKSRKRKKRDFASSDVEQLDDNSKSRKMPKTCKKTKGQVGEKEPVLCGGDRRKDRGKAAPTRLSPQKEKEAAAAQAAHAEEDSDSDMEDREDRDSHFGADEDLPCSQQTVSSSRPLTDEQEEKIAQFFEDNTFFYDMGDNNYKNKVKRRHLLGELAKSLGFEAEMADKIYKRFCNIRTDYQKLREREAKGKTGSSKPFTPLQQWKLKRYAFLQPFYRGNKKLTSSQVLGSIPQPETSDEQDSDLESLARRPDIGSASPSPMKPSKKSKKDKNLTEVLVNLVSESKQELKESQAALVQASGTSQPINTAMSETEAWTQWMASVHHNIPKHLWHQYQSEAFALVMKYVAPAQQQQQPQHVYAQQAQPQYYTPPRPAQPIQQQTAPQQHGQQQRLTRVLSAPSATWQDTNSHEILSGAMATLQSGSSSSLMSLNFRGMGDGGFSDLLGNNSQLQTSAVPGTCSRPPSAAAASTSISGSGDYQTIIIALEPLNTPKATKPEEQEQPARNSDSD